jgi:hypothetical protein
LIFLVVLISVFHVRYGIKIPGLLAGSGIAAVIIGLAMQDLLGNILSGFALHVGKRAAIITGRSGRAVDCGNPQFADVDGDRRGCEPMTISTLMCQTTRSPSKL